MAGDDSAAPPNGSSDGTFEEMNVVIVAPCHVPFMIGGSEKLWWGLLEHLNRHTSHQADIVKLPTPEGDFWEVVESYQRFSEFDLSPYEVIISGKYPAWMVDHPSHICYYQHPLRGLYDTYPEDLPPRCEVSHPAVKSLVALLRGDEYSRDALRECFERVARLRAPRMISGLRRGVPRRVFAFPGPLIREIVQFCDRVAFRPGAIKRVCAISSTVASREGYFPPGAEVTPVHPPSDLRNFRVPRPGRYLFTVSRLDGPKRIDLLIETMSHVHSAVELWIAGTGPSEGTLRKRAAKDGRIHFLGYVNDDALLDLYADALAVLFIPFQEDLGLVAWEAMSAGKPVITTTDSGGARELVRHGATGYVSEPEARALAACIESLVAEPRLAATIGERGAAEASKVTWKRVSDALLSGLNA